MTIEGSGYRREQREFDDAHLRMATAPLRAEVAALKAQLAAADALIDEIYPNGAHQSAHCWRVAQEAIARHRARQGGGA